LAELPVVLKTHVENVEDDLGEFVNYVPHNKYKFNLQRLKYGEVNAR